MKTELKFNKIARIVKEQQLLKGDIIDGDGNVVDSVFTTSQEMDVHEMIFEGFTVEEIIDTIKQWHPDENR